MKQNLLISFILLLFVTCNLESENKQKLTVESKKDFENTLILSHQAFLKVEKERIDHYIDSVGINFKQSGTGLQYHIKSSESGDSLKKGDLALISYMLLLLEGDTLYHSPEASIQEFAVDYDNVESGLHEGIKYMKVGDEATFILPAHLAHGITGDQAAIPPQSTLVYKLKLLAKR